jgi:hypothetical protein
VTQLSSDQIAPSAVSRETAIDLARKEFDGTTEAYRVYRATSRQYLNSPDRDVWVVVFPGGQSPFDGPMGATNGHTTMTLTGIIIDAESGEFLRGFMERV